MPTIYKPKKKREIRTDKEKIRRQIYNSKLWQNLRVCYLQTHPLSEISQWEGKTALAEHIHHIISFLDVPKELIHQYAYNPNNLIAVTQEEHNRLHNGDLRGCTTKDEIRDKVLGLMNDK